jgi:hypothetical protein
MSKQSASREVMVCRMREWRESGLSKKAFCEQHSIAYSNFQYWYRRLEQAAVSSAAGFVPIQIAEMEGPLFASVIFGSGLQIQLHQPVGADYLRALIG